MSSKELVPASADLEQADGGALAAVQRDLERIPELVERGEEAALEKMETEARAIAYAARETEQAELSAVAARACIASAAARGQLVGEGRTDRPASTGHLHLGAARMRGHLAGVLEQVDGVGVARAGRIAVGLGLTRVSRRRIRTLIEKSAKERGLSIRGLEREFGLGHAVLGMYSTSEAAEWWKAWRITERLGIDIRSLPPLPRRVSQKGKRSKWRKHTFKPGGGGYDEVGVRFTKVLVQLDHVDPGWANEKPALCEAAHAMSDIIQREIGGGK
jgi:hypothetical protein